MHIFEQIISSFSGIPPWVTILLLPALFLVYAVLTALFGGRASYPFVLCAGCAIEGIMTCAYGAAAAVFACGAFALFAAIVRLLYLLPRIGRNREPRSYRILRQMARAEAGGEGFEVPIKTCAYEDAARVTVNDRGMKLSHAEELLSRLRRASLTPPDRLEADVLARTLQGWGERALSEEETALLSDSLTTLLKLCAKYKL